MATVKNGEFTAAACFGNDRTPNGTVFRLTVLMADAKRAEEFLRGQSLKRLPPDIQHSPELRVVLDRDRKAAEPKANAQETDSENTAAALPTPAEKG